MKAKDSIPAERLPAGDIAPIIEVYFEFNHLKQLYRRGWLEHGITEERCETVAEHSFGVAILAYFLADACFPSLDRSKVLRMALIHDFGEIYAGDITPSDGISLKEKFHAEHESIVQVLGKLPTGGEYIALWQEYEEGESQEARFVRQIDRLEMGLQASVYEHQELADLASFYSSARRGLHWPRLQLILQELEALRGRHLAPPSP